jgi:diguanylate cyclase (GGDEF)-like protein
LRLLATGLALFVVGDLLYGYITLHSSYQSGDPVDVAWVVALALMALAGRTQPTVDRPEQIDGIRERVSWLPALAVAFGFGILLFASRGEAVFPGLVMIAIAIALAGLVLARQVLVQRDLIRVQEQLRDQAFRDGLTGLPNRLLVLDRAERMLSRARRLQLNVPALFVDIDGFKYVNDTFGHAVGDRLLQVVATRLKSALRESDTVGRFGGDEFVVLIDPVALTDSPEVVAERILAAVREPIDVGDATCGTLAVSVSIGISSGSHDTADALLRDADIAMYNAKEAGKNRYVMLESAPATIAVSA